MTYYHTANYIAIIIIIIITIIIIIISSSSSSSSSSSYPSAIARVHSNLLLIPTYLTIS